MLRDNSNLMQGVLPDGDRPLIAALEAQLNALQAQINALSPNTGALAFVLPTGLKTYELLRFKRGEIYEVTFYNQFLPVLKIDIRETVSDAINHVIVKGNNTDYLYFNFEDGADFIPLGIYANFFVNDVIGDGNIRLQMDLYMMSNSCWFEIQKKQ